MDVFLWHKISKNDFNYHKVKEKTATKQTFLNILFLILQEHDVRPEGPVQFTHSTRRYIAVHR